MPPFPFSLAHVWQAFHRLRRRKAPSNGFAAQPLEWSDIAAFCTMTRFPLTSWEVELIEMLDDLFMTQQSKAGADE